MSAFREQLTSLDVMLLMPQSSGVLTAVRTRLAKPLRHKTRPDDRHCLVDVDLASKGPKRMALRFQVYEDDHKDPKGFRLLAAYLDYERLGSRGGPKASARTIGWVEQELAGIAAEIDDLVLATVDAHLELRRPLRHNKPMRVPRLSSGGDELELCGAEYRQTSSRLGLEGYRWAERLDGTLDVWFSYSYDWHGETTNFWSSESERCIRFLKDLL